jgi:hypothetical protein
MDKSRRYDALTTYAATAAPEACLVPPIFCYFGPTERKSAAIQSRPELEMVRRVKVPTRKLFLTADGVATRLAIRELKKAKIDPGPLLAKAGISLLKFGEEPKRVGAESQIRFLEIAAESLGDSALGLHLAQHFDLRECGMLYYVLAASLNIGEAIRNPARYLAVSNESIRLGVSERTKSTVLAVNYKITLRAMVENEIVQLLPHGKAQVEKVASNLESLIKRFVERLSQVFMLQVFHVRTSC